MMIKNRELFYWESALFEQPKDGEKVIVQYKTFEFEQITYTNKKKEWFVKNVQCWLKQFKAQEQKSVEDTAIKFNEWATTEAWELDYREQKDHTAKELFFYFINNIYGK